MSHRSIGLLALLLLGVPHVPAQQREAALSDREVETLRDTAAEPPERVLAFITFLDDRTKLIQKLATGPRRPGREEDLHDLMEQVTSIADDLEDNLEDYGKRHPDLRKVLPKLIAASERWATIVRTPSEHEGYSVSRKLTLEAIHDVREDAATLIEEQRTWFAAHPPGKEPAGRPRKDAEAVAR